MPHTLNRKNLHPPRKCIFCGQQGVSKEHLWSQWMHALLPDIKTKQKASAHIKSLIGLDGHFQNVPAAKKMGQGSTLTVQVRAQCRRCNNEWMSQIEQNALPFLKPMIQGISTTLNPDQQKIVATWMALKTMVAEHTHPDSKAVLAAEYEYLRLELKPPANWQIWIAGYRGMDWRAQYMHEGLTANLDGSEPESINGSPVRNMQSTTIGFGQLLGHAVSTTIPNVNISEQNSAALGLIRIWPPNSHDINWPGATIFDDDGAYQLAHSLAQGVLRAGIANGQRRRRPPSRRP